jgi:hypothetical protein
MHPNLRREYLTGMLSLSCVDEFNNMLVADPFDGAVFYVHFGDRKTLKCEVMQCISSFSLMHVL